MTRTDVESFFQDLGFQTLAALETRRQMDRYLASGVNLLSLFWVGENRFSHLLARLLDPEGGHGQGILFLELFLKRALVGQPEQCGVVMSHLASSLPRVRVSTEHRTDQQRRIDLLIDFGDFGIGIENKPWALDQPDQLLDYSRYLCRTYKGRYLLFYLSGDGSQPGTGSVSEAEHARLSQSGQLLTLGYRPFLSDWAAEAATLCEAEKIYWLLRDTVDWLVQRFPNTQTAGALNER